jgi:uncharacterized membrane protein YfcA
MADTAPSIPAVRPAKLAAIGIAAGAFSGLFGVGGGTVIVPLLILWFAYGEREATGTSLAAIVVIAAFATSGQALHGNVEWLDGVLIAIPAVVGVVVGATVQQRIPQRSISLLFAALLLAQAAHLVVK